MNTKYQTANRLISPETAIDESYLTGGTASSKPQSNTDLIKGLTGSNSRHKKTATASLFDQLLPIAALNKAMKKVGYNAMNKYRFPGSPAAIIANEQIG